MSHDPSMLCHHPPSTLCRSRSPVRLHVFDGVSWVSPTHLSRTLTDSTDSVNGWIKDKLKLGSGPCFPGLQVFLLLVTYLL